LARFPGIRVWNFWCVAKTTLLAFKRKDAAKVQQAYEKLVMQTPTQKLPAKPTLDLAIDSP
jgi:hypothetical protein